MRICEHSLEEADFNLLSTLTQASKAHLITIIVGKNESAFELIRKLNKVNETSK